MKKPKPMKPYTPAWHKQAYELLRSYLVVKPCQKCGGPVVSGYCCNRCGTDEP